MSGPVSKSSRISNRAIIIYVPATTVRPLRIAGRAGIVAVKHIQDHVPSIDGIIRYRFQVVV